MINFNNLEVDHLSKQQVVASDDPHQGFKQRPHCGILILSFDYIWPSILAYGHHPSDFKRVVWHRPRGDRLPLG
jgi:hypothetical protein